MSSSIPRQPPRRGSPARAGGPPTASVCLHARELDLRVSGGLTCASGCGVPMLWPASITSVVGAGRAVAGLVGEGDGLGTIVATELSEDTRREEAADEFSFEDDEE
jgi:hypothetical protein